MLKEERKKSSNNNANRPVVTSNLHLKLISSLRVESHHICFILVNYTIFEIYAKKSNEFSCVIMSSHSYRALKIKKN